MSFIRVYGMPKYGCQFTDFLIAN
ncbi:MAG: hypothetical protein JWM12_3769, partial [Ilumatobacteraceae bacterium]|nr:hypothetical protein [Ilumatobacteraceae bacterium]